MLLCRPAQRRCSGRRPLLAAAVVAHACCLSVSVGCSWCTLSMPGESVECVRLHLYAVCAPLRLRMLRHGCRSPCVAQRRRDGVAALPATQQCVPLCSTTACAPARPLVRLSAVVERTYKCLVSDSVCCVGVVALCSCVQWIATWPARRDIIYTRRVETGRTKDVRGRAYNNNMLCGEHG
jgi:hypothetical protein